MPGLDGVRTALLHRLDRAFTIAGDGAGDPDVALVAARVRS